MTRAATPVVRRRSTTALVAGAILVTALDALLLALGLGGFAALLRHARALALLAAWLAGGIWLALARPIRTHDPVDTLPDPLGTMIALLLLPLLIPPVAAYGERIGLWPLPGGAALRWAGVALSAAGLALRIAAMVRLGSRFSPWIAAQRDHVLETGGPYARIRHPGYAGTLLAALGAVLAFGSAVGLVPFAVLFVLLDRRAHREEALLERHFGEAYRHYRMQAGRFAPGPGSGASPLKGR